MADSPDRDWRLQTFLREGQAVIAAGKGVHAQTLQSLLVLALELNIPEERFEFALDYLQTKLAHQPEREKSATRYEKAYVAELKKHLAEFSGRELPVPVQAALLKSGVNKYQIPMDRCELMLGQEAAKAEIRYRTRAERKSELQQRVQPWLEGRTEVAEPVVAQVLVAAQQLGIQEYEADQVVARLLRQNYERQQEVKRWCLLGGALLLTIVLCVWGRWRWGSDGTSILSSGVEAPVAPVAVAVPESMKSTFTVPAPVSSSENSRDVLDQKSLASQTPGLASQARMMLSQAHANLESKPWPDSEPLANPAGLPTRVKRMAQRINQELAWLYLNEWARTGNSRELELWREDLMKTEFGKGLTVTTNSQTSSASRQRTFRSGFDGLQSELRNFKEGGRTRERRRIGHLTRLAKIAKSYQDVEYRDAMILANYLLRDHSLQERVEVAKLTSEFAHWNQLGLAISDRVSLGESDRGRIAALCRRLYGNPFVDAQEAWREQTSSDLLGFVGRRYRAQAVLSPTGEMEAWGRLVEDLADVYQSRLRLLKRLTYHSPVRLGARDELSGRIGELPVSKVVELAVRLLQEIQLEESELSGLDWERILVWSWRRQQIQAEANEVAMLADLAEFQLLAWRARFAVSKGVGVLDRARLLELSAGGRLYEVQRAMAEVLGVARRSTVKSWSLGEEAAGGP